MGEKFSRLLVVERYGTNYDNRATWKCICDCDGKEVVVSGKSLRQGYTKSCGCLNLEVSRERFKTHNESRTRLYGIYTDMKKRCYNINFKFYMYYGGRGITICEEWMDNISGYISFKVWADENGYEENLTIDRILVNGNYEPSNCRWVTMKDQQNNKRNNVDISINGETKTASQWSESSGIKRETIVQRFKKGSREEDLLKPVKEKENPSNVKGVYWHSQSGNWRVQIKRKYIGSAKNIEGAIKIKEEYSEGIGSD